MSSKIRHRLPNISKTEFSTLGAFPYLLISSPLSIAVSHSFDSVTPARILNEGQSIFVNFMSYF